MTNLALSVKDVRVDPQVFGALKKGFLILLFALLLIWIKVIEALLVGVRRSLQNIPTNAVFIVGLALFLLGTWLFIIPSVGWFRKVSRGFTPIYRLLIIGFFIGVISTLLVSPFLYALVDLGLTRLFYLSVIVNASILYSGFTGLTLFCLELADTLGEKRFATVSPLFLIPLLHIAASIAMFILIDKHVAGARKA